MFFLIQRERDQFHLPKRNEERIAEHPTNNFWGKLDIEFYVDDHVCASAGVCEYFVNLQFFVMLEKSMPSNIQ